MRAAVYADQIVAGDIRILWVDITSRSGMVLCMQHPCLNFFIR